MTGTSNETLSPMKLRLSFPAAPAHLSKMFQDYYKALEDADEKVQLANQIYDLVSNPAM